MPVLVAALMSLSVAVSSNVGVPDGGIAAALSFGDRGPQVEQLNEQLNRAGFHADSGSVFASKTRHAVYAFQKHHRLPTTGNFTPFMWRLLDQPIELPWRPEADRVEVDLSRQVLYLVEDHQVSLILPVSSGNEGTYLTQRGNTATARTPEGVYRFQRRISGMREAFLGKMWNPFYYVGGYAIHGSPSVPNYPASHGCIRVMMWDMDLLIDRFEIGMTLCIYGKRSVAPPPGIRAIQPEFI